MLQWISMQSVERERFPVTERPDDIEVPKALKKDIEKVETAFTATVKDDKGKPIVQGPGDKKVVISIPSDQPTLQTQAKGKPGDSLTWFARFWLRMIKKAIHFGKKIVIKQAND